MASGPEGAQAPMTAYDFEAHTSVRGGSARVTLVGELDLDTARHVREAVAACLAEQPKSLCIDLTGVSFCDCSGLNALLTARMSVLQAGADFAVEGIGPQPARVLALSGTAGILPDARLRRPRRYPADGEKELLPPTRPPWSP